MKQRRATVTSTMLLVCSLVACAGSDDSSATHGHSGSHAGTSGEEDDFKGCPDGYPNVAPGLQVMGEQLVVKVISATPAEPERYINGWKVELSDRDGSPAPGAELIRGETFMPVHGHDGRVQPKLTALEAPGQFEVDRLNFTMRGPWEVRFWLRAESGAEDLVVFDVCVAK